MSHNSSVLSPLFFATREKWKLLGHILSCTSHSSRGCALCSMQALKEMTVSVHLLLMCRQLSNVTRLRQFLHTMGHTKLVKFSVEQLVTVLNADATLWGKYVDFCGSHVPDRPSPAAAPGVGQPSVLLSLKRQPQKHVPPLSLFKVGGMDVSQSASATGCGRHVKFTDACVRHVKFTDA